MAKSGAAREAEAAPPVAPERRFVDIDPWAVLLEGLMATPEEEPAERKPTKGNVGRGTRHVAVPRTAA